MITGGGPLLETLKKSNPDILFTGYLQKEQLYNLYAAADIFTFPSTTETLGNVVLEAMASGLPVIVPAAGGLKENIIHEYNGLLSEPNDVASFTNAIDVLVNSTSKRNVFAKNARIYAKNKSWESVFHNLLKHYHTVIKGHQSQPEELQNTFLGKLQDISTQIWSKINQEESTI